MDREFRWLKQQNQAKLREIFSIIENWYNNHKQDVPLKKSGEKNISSETKQKMLAEHFWRLFNSYARLKSDPDTEQSRINNTLGELAAAIHLLSK